jgi:hypothetical protein
MYTISVNLAGYDNVFYYFGEGTVWNAIPYKGSNVLVLWSAAMEKGYAAPIWMTYRQASELKANVRKGAHGSRISLRMQHIRIMSVIELLGRVRLVGLCMRRMRLPAGGLFLSGNTRPPKSLIRHCGDNGSGFGRSIYEMRR